MKKQKLTQRKRGPRPTTMNAVDLEVLWSRLITVVDEAAYAILRTSMSKIVVEARDFGALLLDPEGKLLISDAGVASKIGTNSIAVRELLKQFPRESLKPGDMLITNNPWWIMGHLNDVAIVAPLFHGKRLVGFAECMAHMSDIGGCLSASPREVYEEGLIIPPIKIMEAGRENATFFDLLKANVRVPLQISSDLRALISGCHVMQRELGLFLSDTGMPDLSGLGGAIVAHSRRTMRTAIRAAIPDGVYRGETLIEGSGTPLEIKVTITAQDGELDIDFTGSSPQRDVGVNCTLVYTHVWSVYIMKCLLAPALPNNEGTFAPIRVSAPEGTFLNPRFPAPVRLKSSSGHFIPDAIIEALQGVLADKLIAESGNKFAVLFSGRKRDGHAYAESMFIMGGMGARARKNGLHCASFPANSSNLPIEVLEATVPVRVRHKRIRRDSGGAGTYAGGCGQDYEFESLSALPMMVRASHGKLGIAPKGLLGGGDGKTGAVHLNDKPIADKTPVTLKQGDVIRLLTPGSGGMRPPVQEASQAPSHEIETPRETAHEEAG
ncbi:MAG TPA: hydantoinase B/oxoprolinase family protein [Burkholderiales bacterium]|nr:hydantoinase B/oxoprolinase family protein [Burkholderiales bacterium]